MSFGLGGQLKVVVIIVDIPIEDSSNHLVLLVLLRLLGAAQVKGNVGFRCGVSGIRVLLTTPTASHKLDQLHCS